MLGSRTVLKESAKRREHFHGKDVLDEFRKRHLHATGMSREIFIYQCAKEASKRKVITEFVDGFFARLEQAEQKKDEPVEDAATTAEVADVPGS